jgi:hypothetical protein
MAHEGIYAGTTAIMNKLGDNYETDFDEDRINQACLEAEGLINCTCRKTFAESTTAFNALGTTARTLLTGVSSNLVGIEGLTYKPSGEDGALNRIEFEDRINILRDGVLRGLSILRDKKTQDYIDNA